MQNNDLVSKSEFLESLDYCGADICADYEVYAEHGYSFDLIRQTLDKLPPVEAVPIVRCERCIYRREFGDGYDCRHPRGLNGTMPNDFCSFGKAKTND